MKTSKKILKNGLRVIYTPTNTNIIAINVSILVGSDYESKKNLGISHFLEHMIFEGTKTRTCEQITSEIEQYGGEINAYTSNDKTVFYIKIHKKHAKKAIEILSDMIIHSEFNDKSIAKEKNVVLGEINMVNDEPRHYQWVLFEKKLFPKPFSNATYGTKKTVSDLSRKNLVDNHKKHYTPNNMIVSIVGEYKNYITDIKQYFRFKNKKGKIRQLKCTTKNKKKIFKEKKKNLSLQYLIIGYLTPTRISKVSYTLDVIKTILAKGQSGKLFTEIRTKRGLTYDLGIYHQPGRNNGFFAFYSNAKKKNIQKIEEIFFQELERLKDVSENDIKDAKSYIEGKMALKIEDSHDHADLISLFEECKSFEEFDLYIKKIRSVTKKDIISALKTYLNKNYTKVVLS